MILKVIEIDYVEILKILKVIEIDYVEEDFINESIILVVT